MPSVTNKRTESILRKILRRDGYQIETDRRELGDTGVDIIALKNRKKYYIEVIGYKRKGPARSKDFYQGFFRTVSRLNDGAKHLVFALPKLFKRGMLQRVQNHKVAWKRIGKTFPELEIWLIDTEKEECEKVKWNNA